jgi:hypothetical protein
MFDNWGKGYGIAKSKVIYFFKTVIGEAVLLWCNVYSGFTRDRFGSMGLFNEFICCFGCFIVCIRHGYGWDVGFVITILWLGLLEFSIGLYDYISIFYASWKICVVVDEVSSFSFCL